MENYPSETNRSGSTLENFKGNLATPFETVAKNEPVKEYPYPYSNQLRGEWSKVCQLMNWQKNNQPIDWNFFKVAEDPFKLVVEIQNAIIKRGGKLPRYGIDGKFGKETKAALESVLQAKNPAPEVRQKLKDESREPAKSAVQNITGFMARSTQRIKDANLTIEEDAILNSELSEADVAEYQTRAWEFREKLGEEEPNLKIAEEKVRKAIEELKLETIDLSKIQNETDFKNLFTDIMNNLKVKSEINMQKVNPVNLELFTSFLLSVSFEVALLMTQKFKRDEKSYAVLKSFIKKGIL